MMQYEDFSPVVNRAPRAPEAPQEETVGDALRRGFDSGTTKFGADLNQLAGLAGENVGANDFAQGRYAAAKAGRERAAAEGPEIDSLSKVNSLNTVLRFGAGQLGAMAPVAGAAIAGGLITRKPFLGGTLGLAPTNVGEVASRQMEDPAVANLPASDRGLRALAGGTAAAAVQNIGPGMFAGKVAGKLAGTEAAALGKQSLSSIMAKNVAEGVGVNAAGSGAGEAITQYAANPDAPFNTDQIKDSAIAGGVMGGAFGVAGGAAEGLRSRGSNISSAVRGAADAVGDKFGAAKDAAVEKLGDAKEYVTGNPKDADAPAPAKKINSLSDDIGEMYARGRDSLNETFDKISKDEPLVGLKEFATEAGQKLSDSRAAQAVTDFATRASESIGITPEMRQKLVNVAGNATDKTTQLAAVALKKTFDAGVFVNNKLTGAYDTLRAGMDAENAKSGVKQSADYSGANRAIAEKLGPMLARREDITQRPDSVEKLTNVSRMLASDPSKINVNSDTLASLIDVLGSDTGPLLDAAYGALHKNGPVQPGAAEAFYQKLDQVNAAQKRFSSLKELVGSSLTDDANKLIPSSEHGSLTQNLVKMTRGEYNDPNAGPYQRKVTEEHFSRMFQDHFGDNADKVSVAIEKEARVQKGIDEPVTAGNRGDLLESDRSVGEFDDNGNRLQDEPTETRTFGLNKAGHVLEDGAAVMDPGVFASTGQTGKNSATQLLTDMRGRFPGDGYNVRFERIPNSDMGHVVVEKIASPEQFNTRDLADMKIYKDKNGDYKKNLIKVGGMQLDSEKIANAAGKKQSEPRKDDTSRREYLTNSFMDGVARLTEQHGNFDIPDGAVLGKVGGENFTYADAKKFDRRTKADKTYDKETNILNQRRALYDKAVKEGDTKTAKMLKDASRESMQERANKRDAELAAEDGERRGKFDEDGEPIDATSDTARDPSKDDQISTAAANFKATDLISRSNMDGSAKFLKDRPNDGNIKPAIALKNKLLASDNADDVSVAKRLGKLIQNADIMSKGDRRVLERLGDDLSASDTTDLINPLVEKYSEAIVANKNTRKTTEPILAKKGTQLGTNSVKFEDGVNAEGRVRASEAAPGILSKAIDKRMDYLDNPPDDYNTKTAEKNLEWASKQKEHVDAEVKKMGSTMDDPKFSHDQFDVMNNLQSKLRQFITDSKAHLENEKDMLAADKANGTNLFGGNPDKEGTSSPKSLAAKKAAAFSGDKQSVEQMQQKFPELSLRQPTLNERAQISTLQETLNNSLGKSAPEVTGVSIRDGETSKFAAKAVTRDGDYHIILSKELFDKTTPLLGSTVDKVERAYNHEVGHLVDRDLSNFSDSSDLFFPDGKLHAEIAKYATSAEGQKWFGYALDAVRNPQRELFAQAFSLFHYNPEVMREALPQTDKFFKTLAERSEGRPAAAGRTDLATEQQPTVADKKARIVEAANADDPALIKELSATDDARKLQGATVELAKSAPDSKASEVANKRMGELVQDPDTALNLTKKYSMDGARENESRVGNFDVAKYDLRTALEQSAAPIESAHLLKKLENAKTMEDLAKIEVAHDKIFEDWSDDLWKKDAKEQTGDALNWAKFKSKFDKSESGAARTDTPESRAQNAAYITKVLADSVKLAYADLTHAGEFERMRLLDHIRLATTALDPLSTLHHEALHAFFAQLKDAKATDITSVLEKAAASENVIRQLNERYAGNDAVLAQLKDPEERAAYMYQHWAAGDLKIGPQVKNVFTKIADYIRSVMGIWTNDQRATKILEYFNSGEYAKSGRDVGAAREALIDKGHNNAIAVAKSFTEPLLKLGEAVLGTGSGRLRDTNIAAIQKIADLIKRDDTDVRGGDQGYIPAAGIEYRKRRGALAEALQGYSPENLKDALEGLQRGKDAATPEGRSAQKVIKNTLKETRDYLVKSGVDVGDLGPDYFPRVYDTHYISKNQQAFKDMLEPHVRRGDLGSSDDLMRSLMSRGGNEFGIEKRTLTEQGKDAAQPYRAAATDRRAPDGSAIDVAARPPGFQFKKERSLAFITPEEASMFVKKDLMGTLDSYISQATRKAEWTRRLGNGKLEDLLQQAREQGATPDQLKLTDTYLKGVDGTLGDNLNPHARRIMGNLIVYQNLRLLPFAAFSSVVDPAGVLVRGGTIKDAFSTFKRGISEIPESFGRKGTMDHATYMSELVGVVDKAILTGTLGDAYTQGMVGGFAEKANNLFFKANLMEGLNRSFRIGATEAAAKFITRHADGTDSVHSARWIKELGLEPSDIKTTSDGHLALTREDGLSEKQVDRVHAALNQWVDGAVLRPDAADKPIWFNDPHFALISHLKQFTYAFQKVIIGRVVHEYKQGNYAPAMALASYVPIMLAADTAKGLIQGGGEQPDWKKGWDLADYVGYATQRGGLLGVGQFGLDMAKDIHRGGTGIGALTGPTIEQFGDAVQLLGGHKQFGPFVLNALPANALYAHAFGKSDVADPMFSD